MTSRSLAPVLLAGLALAASSARLRAQEPAVLLVQSELFVNANLVDGRGGEPRPESAILVQSGEIRAIGAREQLPIPEGTTVVDLEGAWVVPGFIDVSADPRSREDLTGMLLAGVTGVRVARTGPDAVRGLEGGGPMPAIQGGGLPIGGPDDPSGVAFADAEAAAREVARQASEGVPFVSLGPGVPADWLPSLMRAGRRANVRVWSDRTGEGWLTALRAGVDVASPLVSLDPALLPEAEREAWTGSRVRGDSASTLIAWLRALDPQGPEVGRAVGALLSRDASLAPLLGRTVASIVCDGATTPCEPSSERWPDALRTAWGKVRALIASMRAEGVRLLAGSATPDAGTPGEGFHRELELLGDAGIPPLEVLSIASRNGAIALGSLHERGTLEAGKKADFVVLGSDPTANIRNARDVRFVLIEGRAWRADPETGEAERVRFR